jgi:CDP-diacylglycerol---glycerol-3-phosphate 3-phosphatidyltransferase
VNLPNSLTVGRIAAAPAVAWLALVDSWASRAVAFVLFIVVAVTDYWDGKLARDREQVTKLGALLDPLADKLLLLATFVPMYALQAPRGERLAALLGVDPNGPPAHFLPFWSPLGAVPLPAWVIAVVLGRELLMTVFRQIAERRGIVISAIGPAKWKTGFQWTWVGAAFFWFSAATLAWREGWWEAAPWRVFATVNALVGVVAMAVAVGLTLYSLWLYIARYGWVLLPGRSQGARE